jgi:hypothetical protein
MAAKSVIQKYRVGISGLVMSFAGICVERQNLNLQECMQWLSVYARGVKYDKVHDTARESISAVHGDCELKYPRRANLQRLRSTMVTAATTPFQSSQNDERPWPRALLLFNCSYQRNYSQIRSHLHNPTIGSAPHTVGAINPKVNCRDARIKTATDFKRLGYRSSLQMTIVHRA